MSNLQKISLVAASAALMTLGITEGAQAGTLYNNWNYSIDAFNDGSGGAVYDIKGLAIKETSDSIFVALTGGTPLQGVTDRGARGGSVGWGDLFFNFSGTNFQTANNQRNLFGIRFASSNDSGVSQLGVYSNVTAMSIGTANVGYGSFAQYYSQNNGQFNRPNTLGTDFVTKQDAYNYLFPTNVANRPTTSNTPTLNVIASGTRIGGIDLLTSNQLRQEGLNFAHFSASGPQTFGFKFDRALLPEQGGNFVASLFLECANDGVAIKGELETVPEPSAIAGLAMLGLTLGGSRLRKRQPQK